MYLSDPQGSVVAIVDSQGRITERVDYDSHGTPRHAFPENHNTLAGVDPDDLGDFITCYFATPPCADADFTGDGNIDPDDLGDFLTAHFAFMATAGLDDLLPGELSMQHQHAGAAMGPDGMGLADNIFGWCGYVYDQSSELYCVRYRHFDPGLGRWMQRDPAGFADSMNLYGYGAGSPVGAVDSLGLSTLGPGAVPTVPTGLGARPHSNGALYAMLDGAWESYVDEYTDEDGELDGSAAEHTALHIAGMIPGFGFFADVADVILYLAEGNKEQAISSAIYAIPIVGDVLAMIDDGAAKGEAIGDLIEDPDSFAKIVAIVEDIRVIVGDGDKVLETGRPPHPKAKSHHQLGKKKPTKGKPGQHVESGTSGKSHECGGKVPNEKGRELDKDVPGEPNQRLFKGKSNKYRRPDRYDARELHENKNRAYVYLSQQLLDYIEHAKATNRTMYLNTRPDTRLSGPLRDSWMRGDFEWRHVPFGGPPMLVPRPGR